MPLTTQDIRKQIRDALKWTRGDSTSDSPLEGMRIFRLAQRIHLGDVCKAHDHVLEQGLQALTEIDELEAQIVRLHFMEGVSAQQIAVQLNLADGTVYNKQSTGITHLAAAIYDMEEAASTDYRCTLEGRLPALAQSAPVGLDDHLAQLTALFCTNESPWLVAIAGMGGMGKTTLADALVRHVIKTNVFDDVGWVTAQQQTFSPLGTRTVDKPALTVDALLRQLIIQLMPNRHIPEGATTDELRTMLCTRLAAAPHLIVVDNLETLTDIESLTATLRTLTNPTKFLLTSRESLYGEPDIYHFPVPELTQSLTLALVREEAQQRNLPHLLAASDQDLQPIVETVGGNPLAVRLVVGQTHIYTLDVILDNLRSAHGQSVENLYTYIYRQAWDILDETTRRTLLVMPIVSSGVGTMERIAKVSKLEQGDVVNALETLVRLNLVDSRGGLNERRYTIHNLTATFLHEQVVQWQGAGMTR